MSSAKPDGFYHGRITMATAVVILPFSLFFSLYLHSMTPMLLVLGCLAGMLVDPDLDQPSITSSEWRIIKIPLLGIILGPLWIAYWLPYALIMSSNAFKGLPYHLRLIHRGLSHTPILGTLTRLFYLYPLYYVLVTYVHLTITPEHVIMFACGLTIADVGHYARDFMRVTSISRAPISGR